MVKIGLLMTLYNEEANIERCLDTISPYLDYFCIGVDEKTTDNTKQKVLDYFEGNTVGKVFGTIPWRSPILNGLPNFPPIWMPICYQ